MALSGDGDGDDTEIAMTALFVASSVKSVWCLTNLILLSANRKKSSEPELYSLSNHSFQELNVHQPTNKVSW